MNEIFASFINYPGVAHADLAWYWDLLRILLRVLISIMFILLLVPPLVWFERRLLGFMQQRQGPNRVGPGGLLQTIADGVKLLMKEDIVPDKVDKTLYVLAPIVMLIPALVTAGVVPWSSSKFWGASAPNANIGILYVLAMSSLGVYGIVLAGWSSNNKYALLGGLRSSAQMISYELAMGLSIITVVLLTGSLGMQDIVADQRGGLLHWHFIQYGPLGLTAAIIYIISSVAETNRAPFDLPEAETELIAGYHIEYTSMKFAMFFMGEYANMVVVSAIGTTLFFGGYFSPLPYFDQLPSWIVNPYHAWNIDWLTFVVNSLIGPFWVVFKIICGLYFFVWLRATLPRLRYDMLMEFGWKGLLPIALVNILCVAVAMAYGWPVGVGLWVVCFVVGLMASASTIRSKLFTSKTRRAGEIRLYSSAQPYIVVGEAGSAGIAGGSSRPVLDQTMLQEALSEASTESEAAAATGQDKV